MVASCGCAAGVGRGDARGALARFAAAARQGDAATLHALLPARHRRAESPEALGARLAGDRAELAALGDAVTLALASGGGPQAEVALRDRSAVTVVDDVDGWRVGDPGFGPPVATRLDGMAGARAAVRALHGALLRRGAGAWREVLSARALGATDADVDLLVAATEDPSALQANDFRSRVTFTLPDGRLLDVVYEQGGWRVDALRDP